MSMEPVQKYVQTLLQTTRHGGRTVMRDEKTLIIFDTPNWGDREFRSLRSKFPECEVTVQAFDGSLSGFIVLVTRRSEPWGFASECAFVLAAAGAFWTAWWLHGYLLSRTAVGL
jgi:hypothetical protein